MSSRLCLDIRQMFFELWEQIVKIVSLSAQINFSWKFFNPGKMFSSIVFFRWGGGGRRGGDRGFQIFVEKTDFCRKIVRSVVWTGLNVSIATFWGKTRFPEKHPIINFFSNIQHSFSFFLVFWHIYQKCVPVSRWNKCVQINVYEIFSEIEQNFVVLWQQQFNRLSKMDYICLEQISNGEFFCLEEYKQLENSFWKSRGLFSWNLGAKLRTILEKFQHDSQNWIAQIRRVLST